LGDATKKPANTGLLSAIAIAGSRHPFFPWDRNAREGPMTRAHLSEVLAEAALVAYSGGFLVLYVAVKLSQLSVIPWLGF
jgi:hypothetical protein